MKLGGRIGWYDSRLPDSLSPGQHEYSVSQTSKIITSAVAALILTPLGIVLTIAGTHSSDVYTYIGMVLVFPSLVIARFTGKVSIPLLTSASSAGLLIFVVTQLAWYYCLVALVVFIHARVRQRKSSP